MAKQFECGAPNCTFLIRTLDEDEIVEHVLMHAMDKHDKQANETRVRNRIEEV